MQYLKVFTDFKEFMEPLNDEEKGRLFVAMLDYAQAGSEPGLEGNERFVWAMAKRIIDREAAAYESKVKHLRRGAAPVSEEASPVSEAQSSVSYKRKSMRRIRRRRTNMKKKRRMRKPLSRSMCVFQKKRRPL